MVTHDIGYNQHHQGTQNKRMGSLKHKNSYKYLHYYISTFIIRKFYIFLFLLTK